jgi:hypothetical protein
LVSQKLARVYFFLTAFLAWETLQDIVELPVQPLTNLYSWIFFITSPIAFALAYLVVLELYRLILEDYPGIASAGRSAVSWSMALAVLIAVGYAIPDLITSKGPFPVLRIYVIFERSTILALLIFLVLIQLFLLRYRLRLSPNRIVYATGYALYFAGTMVADVIATARGTQAAYIVSRWVVSISALILVIGAMLLSRKGEVKPKLEAVDSSADRARLQQQLTDINRMLTRAARGPG